MRRFNSFACLSSRLLANYMLWRVALQQLGTGSKMMRDMKDNLNRHLYGITEKMARWKVCLSQLTGSLAMALSSLYIKHHFDHASRDRVSREAGVHGQSWF